MIDNKTIEKVKLMLDDEFTLADFYEITDYNYSFELFCNEVQVETIPHYTIEEITLEQLCEDASVEGGEECYYDYSITYYVENNKIYKKIIQEETYKLK